MFLFPPVILMPYSFISPAVLAHALMLRAVVGCKDTEPLISRSSTQIHLRPVLLKTFFWETLGAPSLELVDYIRYAEPESHLTLVENLQSEMNV